MHIFFAFVRSSLQIQQRENGQRCRIGDTDSMYYQDNSYQHILLKIKVYKWLKKKASDTRNGGTDLVIKQYKK